MTALKELAEAYMRNHKRERGDSDDLWALNEVDEIVKNDPTTGWEVTTILLDMAVTDEALAYVAAGPLEELLKKHGAVVIDRVESLARDNQRVQLALSGVWMRPHDEIWHRWLAMMTKFGYVDGRRTAL